MTISTFPEEDRRVEQRYVLAEDGSEEYLYNADRSHWLDRSEYLIIDGHAYYPETPPHPVSVWRGREVYAGRSRFA